jgi:hypothetical protein
LISDGRARWRHVTDARREIDTDHGTESRIKDVGDANFDGVGSCGREGVRKEGPAFHAIISDIGHSSLCENEEIFTVEDVNINKDLCGIIKRNVVVGSEEVISSNSVGRGRDENLRKLVPLIGISCSYRREIRSIFGSENSSSSCMSVGGYDGSISIRSPSG